MYIQARKDSIIYIFGRTDGLGDGAETQGVMKRRENDVGDGKVLFRVWMGRGM